MWFLKKKSGYNRQLDEKLERIQMNFENNYKDAAQMNLREFQELYKSLDEAGRLSEKQKVYYSERFAQYNARMKNFTHKDQKPTWV